MTPHITPADMHDLAPGTGYAHPRTGLLIDLGTGRVIGRVPSLDSAALRPPTEERDRLVACIARLNTDLRTAEADRDGCKRLHEEARAIANRVEVERALREKAEAELAALHEAMRAGQDRAAGGDEPSMVHG